MKEPDFSRVEVPLVEPHFDEETTLLHAQPVVPLETVRSKSHTRRNMFLGIALVGALMLGAVGGTLIYKRQAVRNESANSETVAPESPLANADPAVAAGGETEETAPTEPRAETEVPVIEPRRSESKQAVVTRTNKPEPAPSKPERVVKKQPRLEPQEPVAAEPNWDEMMREARRAARRRKAERREQRARRESDGASRIRDIFEGPNP